MTNHIVIVQHDQEKAYLLDLAKDNLEDLGHNQHLAMLKYQLVQPHAKE